MSLNTDYFTLFGLSPQFDIDAEALAPRWRELQQLHHPDKAEPNSAAQREAVQYSALINSAYQTLRDPLLRARYLLSLAGHGLDNESTTVADTDFLMAQMDLREQLDDADSLEALAALRQEVQEWQQSLAREFAIDYAEHDWSEAADTVRKWQFMGKLLEEVKRLRERLEDQEDDF